ncbi:MAG: CoA transferase [Dongiaceae bacterium]
MTPFGFLNGIRVLDLSQFIPGPYATLLLSDLGADVVKIEPPHGDPQALDGPLDGEGVSLWYRIINRNKRVVKLDLKSEQGRGWFDALVASCDVLLESFRPGALERLGYSRTRLGELNPMLVHCALSGWGQNGPYRLRAGHDNNYQASVGVLDVSGTMDEAMPSNPPIADFAGALSAFGLICGALVRRCSTSHGAYIDIGMADAALALMGTDMAAVGKDFDTRRGCGPYSGGWACYNTYRCAYGGYVTLGALEPKFWEAFCTKVSQPNWISRQYEPRPQTTLIAEVGSLFAARSRDDWLAVMKDVETCFHEVLALDEVAANSQVAVRQVLRMGADGIVDALLPAWVDEVRPPDRLPLKSALVEAVMQEWGDRTLLTGPAARC